MQAHAEGVLLLVQHEEGEGRRGEGGKYLRMFQDLGQLLQCRHIVPVVVPQECKGTMREGPWAVGHRCARKGKKNKGQDWDW